MPMKTDEKLPVAVLGRGNTLTAGLLRGIIDCPVVELTPCRAAMEEDTGRRYRAVIVENFDGRKGTLSPCAAARWAMAGRGGVTVVGLDDGEGRRLAAAAGTPVYAYSDGRPQADLSAQNVRLRDGRLEFAALAGGDLLRVSVPAGEQPRLYDYLAALAGALALGVPLERAAEKLERAIEN